MPDTQSSDKTRVTNQTEGGNNNTWGQIADANFEKLARAVAGYQSKAVGGGADVTLTQTESEYGYSKLTGTLTANISVIAVQFAGFYIVENATSGAFSLTFKMTTGTGVAVPQGQKMLLFSDGTNVLNALDYFASLRVGGAADIDGNLNVDGTVASTNTGTHSWSGNHSVGKNLIGAGTATSTIDNFTIDGGTY